MIEQLQARLAELKQEYRTGEYRLREFAQQEMALRETLLRISGAIQVLEELIPSDAPATVNGFPGGADRSDRDAGGDGQVRPEILTVP